MIPSISLLSPSSGKPRALARCSIGCGSWVVRSPLPSAESGVQGTISASSRFMQQSRNGLACIHKLHTGGLPRLWYVLTITL
jgi:hypothetical protein